MDAIAVKIAKLTKNKTAQLAQYQEQFQNAVLLALSEAAAARVQTPLQMQQRCSRLLLDQGLPPHYVDTALIQSYRLLRRRGKHGQQQDEAEARPTPSPQYLAACVSELVQAGVPASRAKDMADCTSKCCHRHQSRQQSALCR